MLKTTKRYYGVMDLQDHAFSIKTTQTEACRLAGISPDTLQRRIAAGKLYIGKRFIIGLAFEIEKCPSRVKAGKKLGKAFSGFSSASSVVRGDSYEDGDHNSNLL